MSRKQNIFPVFIVFCILSMLLLVCAAFGLFPESFLNRPVKPLQTFVFSIFHHSENRDEDQLLVLQKQLVDQQKLQRENQALRDQFDSQNLPHAKLVPAEIIGSPGFIPNISTPNFLIVNAGEKQGIRNGQVAVYQDNIVGIISAVSDSTTRISLLGKMKVAFSATCVGTKTLGLIKGLGNGEILLDNALLSDTLKKDDVVVTKGDVMENGEGYPPGLIVGKIVSIEKNPSSLFQKAKVKSLVDISTLSMVFIKI